MKLAAKRLENIGWIALVFFVAILLYPLSLSVAALRSDLMRVDRNIVKVKQEIRYLETEFDTRANLRQLERWNRLEYGYGHPRAAQYLEGERALANLGNVGARKKTKVAVLVTMDDVPPAGVIGSVFGQAQARSIEPVRIKTDQAGRSDVPKIGDKEASQRSSEDKSDKSSRSSRASTRTQRLARLEDKLLDDGVIKNIEKRAAQEEKEAGR